MRPLLHPALPRLWRAADTLQIGLEPATGVIIGGLDAAAARLVPALDGTRDLAELRRMAQTYGAPVDVADQVIDALLSAGVLLDADQLTRLPTRLEPELHALSLRTRSHGSANEAIRRRRAARVEIVGAGRVGAAVAALLAASGVGRLTIHDAGIVASDHVMPGGLGPDDVGRSRAVSLVDALNRLQLEGLSAATTAGSETHSGRGEADVILLTPLSGLGRLEAAALMRAGVPHLLVRANETSAVVGPFVVPGRTSCLRCQDLHRADRDPAWPRMVIQASTTRAPAPAPAVASAALVSAVAATEVLAFLDRVTPETWDATLEAVLPSPVLRRRRWAPHPACGCHWDDDIGGHDGNVDHQRNKAATDIQEHVTIEA